MPKKKQQRGGTMMTVTGEMPVPPSMAKVRKANMTADRARRRVILERTRAARAKLDAAIAQADASDIAHLPVVTGIVARPPRTKSKKNQRAPAAMPAVPDDDFLLRMQKEHKPDGRRRITHPTTSDRAPPPTLSL